MTYSSGSIPLFFSTPVWGAAHLDLFLKIGLPSLLSAGNLPAITNPQECRFDIFTRREDEASLLQAPSFLHLKEVVPVNVVLVETNDVAPHRTMSDCHIATMRSADECEAAAVFLPPDCVWADGSMRRLQEIVAMGKSIIHMSGLRTDRDAMIPLLCKHLSQDETVLQIRARELVRVGLENLHPIAFTHFWNEHSGGLMPANLYWTVPDEGLALRCFHLHPLMVKSQVLFAKFDSTIDDDMPMFACPDATRDYVVTDSDEILAFEMSGLDRIVGTVCDKGSVEGIAAWSEFGTNKRHRLLGRAKIRLHQKDPTEALWKPIENEGDKIIREVLNLNRKPSKFLASNYPKVYNGRIYAASLGRYDDPHLKYAVARMRIIQRAYDVYNALNNFYMSKILAKDGLSFLHPMWFIWRETLKSTIKFVDGSEESIILIGAEVNFVEKIKEKFAKPDVTILNKGELSNSLLVEREFSSSADLAMIIDLDGDPTIGATVAKLVAKRIAKRVVLLRYDKDQAKIIPEKIIGYEEYRFSSSGLDLCQKGRFILRRPIKLLRGWAKSKNKVLATASLFAMSINYGSIMIIGPLLNMTALLIEQMSNPQDKVN